LCVDRDEDFKDLLAFEIIFLLCEFYLSI
jgi:hypothetical protein